MQYTTIFVETFIEYFLRYRSVISFLLPFPLCACVYVIYTTPHPLLFEVFYN